MVRAYVGGVCFDAGSLPGGELIGDGDVNRKIRSYERFGGRKIRTYERFFEYFWIFWNIFVKNG